MAGSAVLGGLQPVKDGPISDAFVDQFTLPHVLVRTLLTRPECRANVQSTPEGGWTVEFRAPWGNPQLCGTHSESEFGTRALMDSDGVVTELRRLDPPESTFKLRRLGYAGPFAVTCLDHEMVTFSIVSTSNTAAGSPDVPKWTVAQIEQIAIDLRAFDTASAMRKAGVRIGSKGSPVVANESAPVRQDSENTPSGPSPVGTSSGMKWRDGIVLMGVTLLLIGGFAWWRRSRTGT